jgi:hypothetical protein
VQREVPTLATAFLMTVLALCVFAKQHMQAQVKALNNLSILYMISMTMEG